MNTRKAKKINPLMTQWKRGAVYTQTYLTQIGYNHDLVKSYRRSGWIESIGSGAYKLAGDTVDWFGGLYTLQEQKKIDLHAGGRTALELKGYAHYGRLTGEKCFLYANSGVAVPKWFKNYTWNVEIVFKSTNLFPTELKESFTEYLHNKLSITISAPERAALEMLYYIPSLQGFEEALHIMESLITLRPGLVQKLLENCKSVKVKRLFLYMAEKLELPWFEQIDQKIINLGSGKRVIIPNGALNKKYLITVNK